MERELSASVRKEPQLYFLREIGSSRLRKHTERVKSVEWMPVTFVGLQWTPALSSLIPLPRC
jgi:hypothetical protein